MADWHVWMPWIAWIGWGLIYFSLPTVILYFVYKAIKRALHLLSFLEELPRIRELLERHTQDSEPEEQPTQGEKP
jgi:hypothetical protein